MNKSLFKMFSVVSILALMLMALPMQSAQAISSAAPISAGNLVVLRIGTGSSVLSSAATAVFLDEYTTAGASVQTIALPTTASGANAALTESGSATSEGALNRSADGRYLTLVGYDAAPGTANVVTSASATTNRIVARVDAGGVVDTSTRIGDGYTGGNIRSAVTDDGTRFWTGGTSTTSTAGGVRYVPFGNTSGTTTTLVSSAPTNVRVPNIFGGQLYVSSGSSPYIGVNSVGSGLPTTSGQTTTLLPGLPNTGNPYAYVLLDRDASVAGLDTLYIADQTTAIGLAKYSFDGTTWTPRGNVAGVLTGLTGAVNGSSVTLYATLGTGAGNALVTFTDSAAFNATISSGSFTTLATAGTNTVFRGVAFAPQGPPVAPTITTQPQSQTISSGTTAALTVAADGTAPLSYQWYQGNSADTSTPVGTNSASFTTPALSATTSYWVRVSNSAGSADSDTATITVASVPPSITTQPQSQSINSGATATLTVAADGSTPLSYQWYQGNSGDTSTPVGTNSPSFTTPALASTTSYWVRVSNSAGSVDSATATVTVLAACSASDTPIGAVQGTGDITPLSGQTVTIQGVVVGDYELPGGSNQIRGFYLQDAGDGDPATSDGIFVFDNAVNNVSLGQVVQVTGPVSEFQGQTQLSGSLTIESCGSTGSVNSVDVSLPFSSADYLERYEGMLVHFPQPLYVTEHFQLGRFGQAVLSSGARLPQPTNIVAPGAPAQAQQAANDLNRIILDDDNNLQNPDPISYGRGGNPLSASNTLRGGDSVTGLTGVLVYGWAGNSASPNAYRVRALGDLDPATPNFVAANPRPSTPPAVGGRLKAASFNVLNYFLTLDIGTQANCGPIGFKQECRGAETAEELTRQQQKLNQALVRLDGDIVGMMELENTQDAQGNDVNPLADIVGRLNTTLGSDVYGYINTGVIGTDTIRVGIIYKKAKVTPVGSPLVDTSPIHNRPPVAQVFTENLTGRSLTVVVNHFKSKSSCPASGPDNDQGDGQGCWNATRVQQAQALIAFINNTVIPTAGDADVLLLGDFNSYAQEDPIATLESAGFINLVAQFSGAEAYSYVFDGQWGYLDQGLASASLVPQVSGAGDYHINSDEPSVLDYNTNFKSAGQIISLFNADEFRTSDHDPVVVGLDLVNTPPVAANDSYSINEDTTLTVAAPGVLSNDTDVEHNPLTAALVIGPSHGSLTLGADGSFTYVPNADYNGPDSFTYKANDGGLDSNVATVSITVTAVNDAPVCATPQSGSTNEDTALNGSVACTDIDSLTLTYSKASNPSHGTVTVNSNGTFTYTPTANYNGSDSFTFKANDDSLDSNVATFNITISAVNDAPVAVNDSATIAKNGSGVIFILTNDFDVDGDTLAVSGFTQPTHGTVAYSTKNKNFRYTPAKGFTGTDTFTYTISDGHGGTATATVTITVQ